MPGKRVSLKLTADQKADIKKATGNDVETLVLSAEELEERIAPMRPNIVRK